ncbi:MAG: M48 family metallopeptidase [Tenuifilaceae bacterium]
MLSSKTINYPELGNITYKRNLRARRLSISIRHTTGIKVTIPGTLSFRSAESFVLSKSKWIIEKVEYFDHHKTKFYESGIYRTRKHTLVFTPTKSETISVKIKTPYININYPELLSITNDKVQAAALKGIENAFRLEAKESLPQRVEYLSIKHGFKYSRLSIKKTKSRWGSCSSKNNINLSIFLMKLPDELIDYIIIHELCHTIQKNHGPKFWEILNHYTEGKAISLAKEVKKFRAGV